MAHELEWKPVQKFRLGYSSFVRNSGTYAAKGLRIKDRNLKPYIIAFTTDVTIAVLNQWLSEITVVKATKKYNQINRTSNKNGDFERLV